MKESRIYLMNVTALLALLAATDLLAHRDLGAWNTPVSLGIAGLKATLVAVYFMSLRRADGLRRVAASLGVFWLGILIFLVLTDYLSRGWLALP